MSSFFSIAKKTYTAWSNDNASRIAAALAFYATFSLAPLLIICISVAGLVVDKKLVQTNILTEISHMLGPETALQIQMMIEKGSTVATDFMGTVIGVLILLFGAAGFFGELQSGLNSIWQTKHKTQHGFLYYIKNRFLSFSIVLGVAFLLLVSLIISTVLTFLATYFHGLFPGGVSFIFVILDFIVSFGLITLLFALIYKILPDAYIEWDDVWSGSAVTALLFMLGKFLLQIYLSKTDLGSAYGAAGSLIVILVWVYYSSQILFFGAEFTKITATKRRN